MAVASVDTWGEVQRLRLEFADQVAALSPDQWDIPSWCAGWRVRDVLGHLVSIREASQRSMIWRIIRSGLRPDHAVDLMARELGHRPVPELVERLRAARDLRIRGLPPELALGDIIVHSADAFRPAGIMPDPPVDDVVAVLDTYKKWGRRMFHTVPHRDVLLKATDADWCLGSGPEVSGRAIDLLLLVSNRVQIVGRLHGPGLGHLTF